ncbi:tRNA (adenosine(37)-N6)-threonylcarbamoyltransferase complex transferase subunit TsaD [Egibacter rhizosphaerae]|uniref:tRNA N6-adenosine threonylcarbamoyltransferase n=1 Tax=Egibacter rhizosphaerae TaxID=1670831 RepID=A0A411YH48_9ACTN|nr:tRNA (adenosine(37)-N6)-threonylcarbamoyltransferase complex transferase subunit TsaD [Egibacter rhizosphaerae]QBI20584.1 tRNA (adenosine(37)-N6)-threonylcarbamoyltransferase complex transferase subunit TsaD [Egibacter rhizosphaerae]
MLVLGIETSCDETAAALVADGRVVRANVIGSQWERHRPYGGVVPEVAARAHHELLLPVLDRTLAEGGATYRDLDAVAVTHGPGLVGALLVGLAAGKAVALAHDAPLIGVNHLEGHVYAAQLEFGTLEPPAVALVVSGGHTNVALLAEDGTFATLGTTIDDAAGEAFDKVARFLGLPYPGGPEIDRAARTGDPAAIAFPRAKQDGSYDFSLSGLKTAVVRELRRREAAGQPAPIADVAASFQEAVVDVAVDKTLHAATDRGIEQVVIAGGVAANSRLRERMEAECATRGLRLLAPSPALCTDNGAMIAAAGTNRLALGERSALDLGVDPNLALTGPVAVAGGERP